MPLKLEDIKKLLGAKELPGNKPELQLFVIIANNLVKENGEDWLKEHDKEFLSQWENFLLISP